MVVFRVLVVRLTHVYESELPMNDIYLNQSYELISRANIESFCKYLIHCILPIDMRLLTFLCLGGQAFVVRYWKKRVYSYVAVQSGGVRNRCFKTLACVSTTA